MLFRSRPSACHTGMATSPLLRPSFATLGWGTSSPLRPSSRYPGAAALPPLHPSFRYPGVGNIVPAVPRFSLHPSFRYTGVGNVIPASSSACHTGMATSPLLRPGSRYTGWRRCSQFFATLGWGMSSPFCPSPRYTEMVMLSMLHPILTMLGWVILHSDSCHTGVATLPHLQPSSCYTKTSP